ncbi:BREX-3 system P-loop-containing protein BrxF [Rivularia sp. UHCC 0363]|uniref:BREX-3 system P-loop-containing protein BrxF n=1 Tax=Rivularia sp. UHCC 0363 TaxID=3110244 RepID=UPI002B21676B|nr:BREX-3 system P-loop-containing protein BrxF [Rivularia sp. UHCC 0363]MEA5594796.1 BREX-3 system P-loop-containing protein BrxF [Rivularia sp. UHCC 0363]
MSLTLQQQAAAYACGSVAVIAGAGTGKTYMLAERYLHHLQADFSPLEIVAVTFTKKAAFELRSRIRSSVSQRFPNRTDLIAELEAAQISTIDALAMRICQEHPEVAGVPADFTVLDKLEGSLKTQQWLDEALDTLPIQLYDRVPYSLMSQGLQILLSDPISAEKAFTQNTDSWQQLAQDLQQQALNELLQNPVWKNARDTLESYSGKANDKLEIQTRLPALQAINNLEMGGNPREELSIINGLKINVGSKNNWVEGGLEAVKESIKELRSLVENFLNAGLITLEIGIADEKLKAMLPSLREAFNLVREYINRVKRKERFLDFSDLEVCALRALQDNQVQFYYAQRWKAFLIDEFQDTNPVQSEILKQLTQNNLLTIVGDAKQSIYGFRRADVDIFLSWCDEIQNNGGTQEILSTSFRTHKSLVDNINHIFTPLLGNLHQNLDAHRVESPHNYPAVRVFAIEAESKILKAQTLRAEAAHIAKLVKEMLDNQTIIHDKKTSKLRPLVAGDIAILSRTWEPLEVYGEALESLGIPVANRGGGNLLSTREAKDAWALLQFLADTSDSLALIAVLRSPFFAISDKVLFTFIQNQSEESKIDWWKQLKKSDIPELQRPVQVLSELLNQRNLESPTRLLQLADHLTGYTAVITNLPGAARREADWRGFFDFVRQLEHGNSDVFAVVRRLKNLAAAEIEIPRLPLSTSNAVALMTIHAAKGLEWSVVVIPDLTRAKPSNSEVVYFDPSCGVALKLEDEQSETIKPVLYVYLEYLRKQQEQAEALRILYVALTRARDQLILTANKENGGGLELLKPGLTNAGIPINIIPFNPELAKPPVLLEPTLPKVPSELLINSVGSGLFELPVTALSEYALCPKRFKYRFIQGNPGIGTGFSTAKQIGTLTHLALEKDIRDIDILSSFNDTLPLEDVKTALELAKRFDEVADFTPFKQGEREKSVNLKIGKLTLNGIIDVLGENWVLDFKTDQEIDPQHHRFQLWAYAKSTDSKTAHIAYLRHDYLHTFDTAQLEETGKEAEVLVEQILNENYSAIASDKNCSYCAYAEICEDNYHLKADSDLLKKKMQDTKIAGYELISSKISSYFTQALEQYHRLIIVPLQGDYQTDFQQVAESIDGQYININLELSKLLLELTQKQRLLKAERLLKQIIESTNSQVIFLEHLEILFDTSLQLDPLRCLQKLARNYTIVAIWKGKIEKKHLVYAEREHPEYKSYPIDGFLVVNLELEVD